VSSLGEPTISLIVVQAAIGGITTWLCFLAAREIAGNAAGLWAAWLYALEPGQWAWSSLVLSETLFTGLLAGTVVTAIRYVRLGRTSSLLWTAVLSAACAYVRVIGYVLPVVVICTAAAMRLRITARNNPRQVARDVTAAAAVIAAVLGMWHVRNGMNTGYWGFSTQVERAVYFIGSGSLRARDGGSYGDAKRALQAAIDPGGERPPTEVAAEMRRVGIRSVAAHPIAFFTSYAAGIAATLLHPGAGAMLRLFANSWDASPSVTQMITLGHWREARALADAKRPAYWVLTGVLFPIALLYIGLLLSGAWAGRSSPLVLLPCLIAGALLLGSGGPDGESRRRAPLSPLIAVIAAPMLAGKPFRSGTGRAFHNVT
jgi:hypothetical protein